MLCRRASLFEVELNIIETELAKLRGQGNMKMLARKTALEWLAQYTTMTNCAEESPGSNWLEQGGERGAITVQLHQADRGREGRGWGGMPQNSQKQGGLGKGKFTASPTTAEDAEVVE